MSAKHDGGIYPVLYSFFDRDGALDRKLIARQVEHVMGAGVHGLVSLGLASEVGKLNQNERRQLMEWVAEEIAGRVPYVVTVAEPSVAGQLSFIEAARSVGAAWVIIQLPMFKAMPESELVKFVSAVAEGAALPVAIQNNPVNMDVSLSNENLLELVRRHPNITRIKGEGAAIDTE